MGILSKAKSVVKKVTAPVAAAVKKVTTPIRTPARTSSSPSRPASNPPAPAAAPAAAAPSGPTLRDRATNVGNWVKYAFTGSPMKGYTVNPEHKNTLIESVASHPYATAAAATAIVKAPAIIAGARSLRGGAAAASAAPIARTAISGGLRRTAFGAAAGLAAGFLLGGGNRASQDQGLTQNPTQSTNPVVTPTNQPQQNPWIQPQQGGGVGISGNRNRVRFSQDQITTSSNYQFSPQITKTRTSSYQSAGQSAQASQEQTGGSNMGMILALLAGAYILSRR